MELVHFYLLENYTDFINFSQGQVFIHVINKKNILDLFIFLFLLVKKFLFVSLI